MICGPLLRRRVGRTSYLEATGNAGFRLRILQSSRIIGLRTYDWREYELDLNALPQFMTDIDGQPVRFLHVRFPEPDAMPLIMTLSWPNSVAEFMNIIGPLSNPSAYGEDPTMAFHIVADQTKVPTGVSHGGGSIIRRMAEANNNIVHWSHLQSGSHMVAMSDPDTLVQDIRAFFSKLHRQ